MSKCKTDGAQCQGSKFENEIISLEKTSTPVPESIQHSDLSHFLIDQVGHDDVNDIWFRGHFRTDIQVKENSPNADWSESIPLICLERDILSLGPRIHPTTLRRIWTIIAYSQGAWLNIAAFAKFLGVSVRTISRYIDIFIELELVRLLQPWSEDVGKRLVRSSKIFIRDSAFLHALLGIASIDELLVHPVAKRSWEGFCLETLISAAPKNTEAYFYRTSAGTQLDLVLRFPNKEIWVFEIKRATVPKPSRGFHTGADDIKAKRKILIYFGEQSFFAGDDFYGMSLSRAILMIRAQLLTARESTVT